MHTFLTLDPSSTAIGYALWRGGRPVEIGLLTPDKKSASAAARIESMRVQVLALADDLAPDYIVMETCDGPQHSRRGRQASLGVWARACGVYEGALRTAGLKVIPVGNDWTRRKSKEARQQLARGLSPAYAEFADAGKDAGMDVSDAIALGAWWLDYQREAMLKRIKEGAQA